MNVKARIPGLFILWYNGGDVLMMTASGKSGYESVSNGQTIWRRKEICEWITKKFRPRCG
jgi:hypothetical protein